MMKKLWTKYSYSIILVICSFVTCFVVVLSTGHYDKDQYISITVEKGDSVWQLSKQYEGKYQMSKNEFIKWVEKQNNLSANHLAAGEKIKIPVRMEDENIKLASE
ncbi:cell division suppressor protein YneA [Niallia sp. 01092]|uniref:cell division suppressor protein YneA n=1 Tax=unclassified Niallia TaxID=2837522 RepID=UPI003FD19C84